MMMKQRLSLLSVPITAFCLAGCAGVSGDFQCNETTTDRCMTMEQANRKARQKTDAARGKPDTGALPRLVTPVKPASPARSERSERQVTPAAIQPRPAAGTRAPLQRSAETLATVWIAPWVDADEVFHQPGRVAFVVQPPHWQLPGRISNGASD